MLQKTITYKDFNDNERSETFYFNLSKNELTKLDYSKSGGLTEWITRATEAQDGKTIIEVFEKIIEAAYGVKSPDGKMLVKTPEKFLEFKSTNAYDVLFMELVTDAEKAAKFLMDCMPADVREEALKQQTIKNNLSGANIKTVEGKDTNASN